MRAGIEGLTTPRPLGGSLPPMFLEDEFAQRLTRAFDDVIAPVHLALDNLDAYLDPAVTPGDFLEWLAGWVGVTLDENWPLDRRRALVGAATGLYRSRGTLAGLEELVRLYAGVEPEIQDNGGVAWSNTAGGALPGRSEASLSVRLRAPQGSIDEARLTGLIAAAVPAHVPHTLEVVAP